MEIKKIYNFEENEPETVIYLLYDYYLYDNIKVNLNSKSTKAIVLLKNNKIPEQYKKHFLHKIFVESKKLEEIKILLEKFLEGKNKEKTKIVACQEDYSYLAYKLRKILKIPGMSFEKTSKLYNKVKMKNFIKKHNIPTHKYLLISKKKIQENINSYIKFLKREINYPMFLKPTEAGGSRGTKKIKNEKELKKILKNISRDNIEYEIDEYIGDNVINCEVIVIKGEIVYFRTRIGINNLHNFSNGENYSSIIVPPSHQEYKKGFIISKKVVEAFSEVFENKCVNLEFIEEEQEKLLFLELNYRRPGAKSCFILDFGHENGFNYEAVDLDLAFGAKKVMIYKDDFKTGYDFYSGSILFPGKKKGIVKEIRNLPKDLNSEVKLILKLEIGDCLEKTVDNAYIPAFIIIRNKCFKSLYREIQMLISWYPYILE